MCTWHCVAGLYMYIGIHLNVHTYIHTYLNMHIYIFTCIYTYIHIYIYVGIHIYVYIYKCILFVYRQVALWALRHTKAQLLRATSARNLSVGASNSHTNIHIYLYCIRAGGPVAPGSCTTKRAYFVQYQHTISVIHLITPVLYTQTSTYIPLLYTCSLVLWRRG